MKLLFAVIGSIGLLAILGDMRGKGDLLPVVFPLAAVGAVGALFMGYGNGKRVRGNGLGLLGLIVVMFVVFGFALRGGLIR